MECTGCKELRARLERLEPTLERLERLFAAYDSPPPSCSHSIAPPGFTLLPQSRADSAFERSTGKES